MFTTATAASQPNPAANAAVNTISLPANTAVGGVPTRPSRHTVSATATAGRWRNRPRKSASVRRRGIAATTANAPRLVTA